MAGHAAQGREEDAVGHHGVGEDEEGGSGSEAANPREVCLNRDLSMHASLLAS